MRGRSTARIRPGGIILIAALFPHLALASVGIKNLGKATGGFLFEGNILAFIVGEFSQNNTDLNGDGDTSDFVLHVFNTRTANTTNLGLTPADAAFSGNLMAFTVHEPSQGNTDLNGDGDAFDVVLHLFDAATGTTTDLGLATDILAQFDRNSLTLRVSEFGQGQTDLNGDGDALDSVVHFIDFNTGTTTNLGLAGAGSEFHEGNLVAVKVFEASQGHTDLNGDGDTFDSVQHVFDAATGTATNLGLATTPGDTQLEGNLLAFLVSEANQGDADLNGDGDTFDRVPHVFDGATGTITNLESSAGSLSIQRKAVAFRVWENLQGTDSNGDGDTSDRVPHVFDAARGTTRSLGLDAERPPRFEGSVLAFPVSEVRQGHTDLNGDGDASDLVPHLFDVATGFTTNVGLAVTTEFQLSPRGKLLAIVVSESSENRDLNGDGDTTDGVPHVFDIATGSTTNLGLASFGPLQLDDNVVAFVVSEFRQGTDLNGDGDASDSVPHLFDAATGTTTNLGLASIGDPRLEGNVLVFRVSEAGQGNTDFNGDGDTADSVLHVANLVIGGVGRFP